MHDVGILQSVIKPIKVYSITEINDIYKCILFQAYEWTFAWIQILICHYNFLITHECITK
jgi:hypothetical protein